MNAKKIGKFLQGFPGWEVCLAVQNPFRREIRVLPVEDVSVDKRHKRVMLIVKPQPEPESLIQIPKNRIIIPGRGGN